MPQSITIGAFVFGAVLVLIALLGGGFKMFGAEIPLAMRRPQRLTAAVLGPVFILVGILGPFNRGSDQPVERTSEPPKQKRITNVVGTWQADNGLTFVIARRGNHLAAQAKSWSLGGISIGEGQGDMDGEDVSISFGPFGRDGKLALTLSPDGRQMFGTYEYQGFSRVIVLRK